MAEIDFGNIISRSIEITKKNKWLWVYGLMLASVAGNFGSGGGGGGSSTKDSPLKNLPKEIPSDLPQKTSQVLGAATSTLRTWFENIPISTWILVGLMVLLVILLWIVISWIIRSWAAASLIYGIDLAENNNEVTLMSTSKKGMTKVKHLIFYSLISALITLATILTCIFFVGIGYIIFNFAPLVQKIWLVLSLIVSFLSIIVLMVIYSMITVYSERLIVLRNFSPWQAWRKGLSLSKNNFLYTVLMGIINNLIGCGAGCASIIVLLIVLGIPAFILVLPIIIDSQHAPIVPLVGGLGLLFILFIYSMHLVNAILTVFRYSNWNLFFKKVIEKEKIV